MIDLVQGEGLVGLTEIEAAAQRLAGVAVSTPLLPADALSGRHRCPGAPQV